MTPFAPLATGSEATPNHRSYWVVPGRLLAGAYPFQADPAAGEERLQGLLDAGVTTFLDLTEAGVVGTSDAHLLEYESALARLEPAAERVALSIGDLSTPTVAWAKEILDAIDARLSAGSVVYVHCWGGVGRTGTIVGSWLVRHGLAGGDGALELLTRLRNADRGAGRRRAPETDRQREFVRRWEAGR